VGNPLPQQTDSLVAAGEDRHPALVRRPLPYGNAPIKSWAASPPGRQPGKGPVAPCSARISLADRVCLDDAVLALRPSNPCSTISNGKWRRSAYAQLQSVDAGAVGPREKTIRAPRSRLWPRPLPPTCGGSLRSSPYASVRPPAFTHEVAGRSHPGDPPRSPAKLPFPESQPRRAHERRRSYGLPASQAFDLRYVTLIASAPSCADGAVGRADVHRPPPASESRDFSFAPSARDRPRFPCPGQVSRPRPRPPPSGDPNRSEMEARRDFFRGVCRNNRHRNLRVPSQEGRSRLPPGREEGSPPLPPAGNRPAHRRA